ncbi:hypothetical protein MPER_12340 [Moniliophthora perniciosa FA553]|nr:hypothetical protein MPER_12340 [Moniliophthora perniciosa FA553]
MNDGIANIFTIQMVLAAPIITIGLTMLLFGFYAPLFGQSFYFLSTRQCAINRRLHLTSITSLFLVAATASFVGAAGVIQDSISMVRALQTRDPEPSRAVFDLITPGRIGLEAINQIGFVVTNCIADYVLIYRLYTIWGSSKRVIALPLVASLVANGTLTLLHYLPDLPVAKLHSPQP